MRWLAFLLLMLFPGVILAEPASTASATPETVIVPYDTAKPVKAQHPDRIYVPYDRFVELWDAAKRTRRGPKTPDANAAYLLDSARYEGVLTEDSVTFHGTIELSTFNNPWVAVPLPFTDAIVISLKVDGAAAALSDGQAVIEKPGRHTVEVTFQLPLKRGVAAFGCGIPPTPGTLVSLALPRPQMRAMINAASGTVEKTVNGQKIVTATLGDAGRVQVTLDSSTTLTRMTQPALARIRSQLTAARALDLIATEFEFSFPAARQDRFAVYLDPAATLVDLKAANVKSWKLSKEAQVQVLEVLLGEPVRDKFTFDIRCERAMPTLPAEAAAPYFGAAAQRVENEADLFSGEGIELTPQPGAGFRQIALEGMIESPGRPVGAYAFGGTGTPATPVPGPAYRVRQAVVKREARVDYVYQVDRRKIELIASLSLDAKGRDLYSATVSVPVGFDVQTVQGDRLRDWWLEGDALRVRFSGETPAKTPLMVYLVRRYPSAPERLELMPLALPEFDTVRGEAIIAAHKGVSASLELSGEAKEIAPETAACDFSILPPLERKRGFSFTAQSFRGTVTLGAQPPRMSSTWVMDARVHESWVSLSMRVQTTLRQGSIGMLSFSLPASLPEAHVAGTEIRETVSKVAGDRRVYDVVFQNEIQDQAGFTVEVEVPSANGSSALPSLEIGGQERTAGFVLVENVSEYEMALRASGLDPAQRNELPFLPESIQSASLFRAHPGFALGIATTRLEKAESRAAFVAWVEITTAFRADGTEWNRAVYHLQNRSLQFLPVKLPQGAELATVRVAGQPTRADAGQVEGQEVTLVPLIKTRQGDLSFEVELVYRMPGLRRGELGAKAHRSLHDPALVGVTVEKTLWNLFVPGDRTLARVAGNMQPVLDEVNQTEKLAGSLQELKELASVASSSSVNESARANAFSNYRKLSKNLEEEVKAAGDSAKKNQPQRKEAAMAEKDADSQRNLVARRAGELQSELNLQNAQISQMGTGALILKGANSYTGGTRVSGGASSVSAMGDIPVHGVQLQAAPSWSENASYADRAGGTGGGKVAESRKQLAIQDGAENLGINDYVVLQNKAASGEKLKRDKKRIAFRSTLKSEQDESEERGSIQLDAPADSKLRQRALSAVDALDFAAKDSDADRHLRPSGRISLAVDFPTEGQAAHFKKLKSNALLEVWIEQPSASAHWRWVWRFLSMAVPLGALGCLLDRRSGRTRESQKSK